MKSRRGAAIVLASLGGVVAAGAIAYSATLNGRRLSQVRRDLALLESAFDSYAVDRCGADMPADSTILGQSGSAATFATNPVGLSGDPWYWDPLTTPVAYIRAIPQDPFRPGALYGYACPGSRPYEATRMRSAAFLRSVGPDGREDVDLRRLREALANPPTSPGSPRHSPFWDESRVLLGLVDRAGLADRLYDPTNGSRSSGDILRFYWQGKPIWGTGVGKDLAEIRLVARQFASATDDRRCRRRAFDFLLATRRRDPEFWTSQLDGAKNVLGPNFAGFIDNPRPLDDREVVAWRHWEKESGSWWRLVGELRAFAYTPASTTTGDNRDISLEELRQVLPALPLLGKSLAVEVGGELATGQPFEAQDSVAALSLLIPDEEHASADEAAARVREELGRISVALSEHTSRDP